MKIKNTFAAICLLSCLIIFTQCKSGIKNESASATQEAGTEIASVSKPAIVPASNPGNNVSGYWVGYFERDDNNGEEDDKNVYADDGFAWGRENKINISIDEIKGESVKGHSVVAGNNRPFSGNVKIEKNVYTFDVKEPGDNKYDGEFKFQIKDTVLSGTWLAFKKIDVAKRKYELKKKVFKYDPTIMLDNNRRFIDWAKSKKKRHAASDEDEEYISSEFASATNKIYEINASTKLLTKKDVENLKKGDLSVIRNTIYARHGYSFKNRPLRVFFDTQDWYIPVLTDIKTDFTEIEKENIKLLLLYEKNAKEYYDYFGRG